MISSKDLARDVIPSGANLVRSVIAHDPIGAIGSMFVLWASFLPENEKVSFHKNVKRLCVQGWDRAADYRTHGNQDAFPEPPRSACVDYIMDCLEANTPPTIQGLQRYPGVGLSEPTAENERASREFLDRMVGALKDDPIFLTQNRVWEMLQSSEVLRNSLDNHRQQLLALHEEDIATRELIANLAEAVQTIQERSLSWDSAVQTLNSDAARYLLAQQTREVRGDGLFDYLSDTVAFQGRAEELWALIRFCETEATGSMRWQAVTGPGGTGKSRLAWQLCQEMRARGWESTFLDRNFFEGKSQTILDWSLPVDTLFVVDYVVFHEVEIAHWMASLPVHSEHKIRVLLLEREGWSGSSLTLDAPTWFTAMGMSWSQQDLVQAYASLDQPGPVLALDKKHLTRKEQTALIMSIRQTGRDSVPRSVAAFMVDRLHTDIDPEQNRPLYLLFLASAYLDDPEDESWRHWDIEDLHSVIYSREIQRLHGSMPEDTADLAADLWAFATATQEPMTDVYADAPGHVRDLLDSIPPLQRMEFRRACRAACGSSAADVVPYVPDIPGEYLVLRRLREQEQVEEDSVRRFSQEAWRASTSGYAEFLWRVMSDFPPDEPNQGIVSLDKLLIPPQTLSDMDDAQDYSNVLSWFVFKRATPSDANESLRLLRELRKTFPEDRHIANQLALGLVAFVMLRDISDAQRMEVISELEDIVGRFPDHVEIRQHYALSLWYCDIVTSSHEMLLEMLHKLKRFSDINPSDDYVVLQFARAVSLLAQDASESDEVYEVATEAWRLAEQYSWDSDIASEVAGALLNLTTTHFKYGFSFYQQTVASMELLLTAHRENADLGLDVAKGLSNVIGDIVLWNSLEDDYAKDGNSGVKELSRQVCALQGQVTKLFFRTTDVVYQNAKTLSIFVQQDNLSREEIASVLEQLWRLTEQNVHEGRFAELYALTLVYVRCSRETTSEEWGSALVQFRVLYELYPDNRDIAREHAICLFAKTTCSDTSENEDRAIVSELQSMCSAFPDDENIADRLSSAALNLTVISSSASKAWNAVDIVRSTYERFPANESLAILSLRTNDRLVRRDDVTSSERKKIPGELQYLLDRWSDNAKVMAEYSELLFACSVLDESVPEQSEQWCTQLRDISSRFPDEPRIVLSFARSLVNSSVLSRENALAAVNQTRIFADRFPDRADIVCRHCRVLANLAARSSSEEVNCQLDEMRTIANHFGEDKDIRLQLVKILILAIGSEPPPDNAPALGQELSDALIRLGSAVDEVADQLSDFFNDPSDPQVPRAYQRVSESPDSGGYVVQLLRAIDNHLKDVLYR